MGGTRVFPHGPSEGSNPLSGMSQIRSCQRYAEMVTEVPFAYGITTKEGGINRVEKIRWPANRSPSTELHGPLVVTAVQNESIRSAAATPSQAAELFRFSLLVLH